MTRKFKNHQIPIKNLLNLRKGLVTAKNHSVSKNIVSALTLIKLALKHVNVKNVRITDRTTVLGKTKISHLFL